MGFRSNVTESYVIRNFTDENYRIKVIDMNSEKLGWRNPPASFNLYGVYADGKEPVIREYVEFPALALINRISEIPDYISLSRDELELIHKYFLIQIYRSPYNITSFTPEWNGEIDTLRNMKFDDEDYYFGHSVEVMKEIALTPWDILAQSKTPEIASSVRHINSSAIIFVRAEGEFVVNDAALAVERQPYYYDTPEKMRNFENWIFPYIHKLGRKVSPEEMETFIRNMSFTDNFRIFPFSPDFAMILVSPPWVANKRKGGKPSDLGSAGLSSDFLERNFDSCIAAYKGEGQDTFVFPVKYLDAEDTQYLNYLMMNCAMEHIALRDFDKVWPSVVTYNDRRATHDLRWVRRRADWSKKLQ